MSLRSGRFETNGSLTTGSLSATIERAINELVPLGANEDPVGRRKLALAIARGVVKHIQDNVGSFHVTVRNLTNSGTHQQSPTVDVDLGGWS
jgi:hypothetical protein